MARKRAKSKNRKRPGFTFPLLVAAGFGPGLSRAWTGMQQGGVKGMSRLLVADFLGYDQSSDTKFYAPRLWQGAIPVVLGLFGHVVATRLGVNRMLARARIPFLRL